MKHTGFSAWKPWEAHGRRPRTSQGFQAEKPVCFITGGTSLFYFTTFQKNIYNFNDFSYIFVVLL